MLFSTRARLPRRFSSVRKLALIIIALASLTLGLAGCGGDDQNVPDGAVAVVDGEEITKSKFDNLLNRAKTSYEQNKRDFPKVGTPEYKTLQNQAVQYLVQQEKYRQKAEELDVEVTDKETDDRLKQVKQQYFGGKEDEFQKNLKSQGLTVAEVRSEIESQLLSEKIYANANAQAQDESGAGSGEPTAGTSTNGGEPEEEIVDAEVVEDDDEARRT